MDHTNEPIKRTKRYDILVEAIELLHGQREHDYGEPHFSFQRIADRWNQRLCRKDGNLISAADVALAMVDLKMARLCESGDLHKDSVLDGIGYFALAFEVDG